MMIFLICVRARLLFYSDQKTADRLMMTDLQLHNYPVQQLELPGVRDPRVLDGLCFLSSNLPQCIQNVLANF